MKAIVFVDVQKDFIDGALRNEKAIEVTPKIVEFAKECVKHGNYKLYATRDTHERSEAVSEQLSDNSWRTLYSRGYLYTLEGQKLPIEHCIEGTDGWMIDDRLMDVIDGKVTTVNKPTFGSFDLAEVIKEDIDKFNEDHKNCNDDFEPFNEIILCGFCTDICCVSCALLLRAKFPNMKITVMKDLCAGTTTENHEAALKVMQSCQIDLA